MVWMFGTFCPVLGPSAHKSTNPRLGLHFAGGNYRDVINKYFASMARRRSSEEGFPGILALNYELRFGPPTKYEFIIIKCPARGRMHFYLPTYLTRLLGGSSLFSLYLFFPLIFWAWPEQFAGSSCCNMQFGCLSPAGYQSAWPQTPVGGE